MANPAGESQHHYFSAQPDTPSRPRQVKLVLPDVTLDLTTDSGVFSAEGVDAGTKYLLLESARPPAEATELLDLGCGYGPIALTLASRAPKATVWAVDVNQRALDLTARNATSAGLENVRTAAPTDIPAEVRFDAVYSNPPIRIGKAALHGLLEDWLPRLRPDGRAVLVVHKNLGSDSLQRWLIEAGWSATRLSSRAGYRLLEVGSA
jgi:16S rRNA (guanine1207-N2)-methyltransferase